MRAGLRSKLPRVAWHSRVGTHEDRAMRQAIWTLDEVGDAADLVIDILPAADDDQSPGLGETPDTRRLEPLPLHRDRRRNLPGVIEQLDLPMSRPMEASRTNETADSNGLSEMAGPGAIIFEVHGTGSPLPRPACSRTRDRRLTTGTPRLRARSTIPSRPIEALDESTPPTIRPEGCIARLVHVFPVTGSPISGVDVDRRGPDHRGPRGHRRREPPANRRGCRSAWSAR